MAKLDAFAGLAGTWRATDQLRGDPSFDGDSPSTATVTPILLERPESGTTVGRVVRGL